MSKVPFYRRRWVQLTASLGLLALLASSLQWSDVVDFMRRGNPWVLLGLALFFPVDRVFMAWKWRLLVKASGSTIGLWDSIRIYLASGALGLAVPLGGVGPDVVRVAMLSAHGMPTDVSVPSILVERVCGIIAAGIMLLLSIALIVLLLGTNVATPTGEVGWTLVAAAVLVGGSVAVTYGLLRSRRVYATVERLVARVGLRTHLLALRAYAQRGRLLGYSVFLAWVEQWAAIIAFYLTCRAFEVPLGILECAAIVPLASILGRLPISFGGIGFREAGIVVIATLFGVPREDALLVSLAEYTMLVLTTLPLAGLYFLEKRAMGNRLATVDDGG